MKKLFTVIAILLAQVALADTIKIIVPYPPGGPTDNIARIIQEELSSQLPDTFIVEYKAGAASAIGTASVANANPSETVLLVNSVPSLVNAITKVGPEYNVADLIPLSYLGRTPYVLVVSTKFNVKSIKEFKKLNSTNPIMFATAGVNSASGITIDHFKSIVNKNIIPVPYKGTTASLVDLMSGQIDGGFYYYAQILPFINEGKVIPIAVEWDHRLSKLPATPTLKEFNISDLGYNNWWVLFSNNSKNTQKLNQIKAVMSNLVESSSGKAKLKEVGLETINQTVNPTTFVDLETKRLSKYISIQ